MRDTFLGVLGLAVILLVGFVFLIRLAITAAFDWVVMRINRKFDQLFEGLW